MFATVQYVVCSRVRIEIPLGVGLGLLLGFVGFRSDKFYGDDLLGLWENGRVGSSTNSIIDSFSDIGSEKWRPVHAPLHWLTLRLIGDSYVGFQVLSMVLISVVGILAGLLLK